MLLFKNGLKHLLKEYALFGMYILLLTLCIIFTSTFGMVSWNLIQSNNNLNQNKQPYDYSYRLTTTGYNSNDTQTISPWFAFNSYIVETNKGYFPTLTIGEGQVLKSFEFNFDLDDLGSVTSESNLYQYKKSYIDTDENGELLTNPILINFHFGDTESGNNYEYSYSPKENEKILNSTLDNKLKIVSSGEFGDFYKFNFENIYFQNSLIGKLYEKFDLKNIDKNSDSYKIEAAVKVYDYMFYVNNSTLTDGIKQTIVNKFLEIYKTTQDKEEIETQINNYINYSSAKKVDLTEEEIIKNGFNGQIGNIIKENGVEKYFFTLEDNLKTKGKSFDKDKTLYSKSSYMVKNFEDGLYFKTNGQWGDPYIINNKPLTNESLFKSYNDLVGALTNFSTRYTNEVVMWDEKGKYRFISAFNQEFLPEENKTITKFKDPDAFRIYDSLDSSREDFLSETSFISSSGYASSNKFKIGNEYSIVPSYESEFGKFRLDGYGTDIYNVYPTIYEEDIVVNQKMEAIFYIHSQKFNEMFNYGNFNLGNESSIQNSKYKDVSRSYLHHTSAENNSNDLNAFKWLLADNTNNLKDISEQLFNGDIFKTTPPNKINNIEIENSNDLTILNMRSNLFGSINTAFLLIAIIFISLFILLLVFIMYTITRKFLILLRNQMGNLKALGVRRTKLIFNFVIYLTAPVVILVPIGWLISLYLKELVMNIFLNYFNIPISYDINFSFMFIELAGFVFITALFVWFISWLTIRQSPLNLLSPSKSSRPNIILLSLFKRIKYKKFTNKVRTVVFASSWKDLVIYSSVIFISSLILTGSIALPNVLTNVKNEYYKNIEYENNYEYSSRISNLPLTQINIFEEVGKKEEYLFNQSPLSAHIKNDKGEFKNLSDIEYWKEIQSENNSENNYDKWFRNIIFNSLTTFNGFVITPGIFDKVFSDIEAIAPNTTTEQSVKNVIKNLSCTVLPSLLNQETQNELNYNDCIKNMSGNIIPATVKENWDKDEDMYKNFSFSLNSVSYNPSEDEMYSKLSTSLENKDVSLIGLDSNTKVKNLNLKLRDKIKLTNEIKNSKTIPISISKKLELEGIKSGDTFKINSKFDTLAFKNNLNELTKIPNELIYYQVNDNESHPKEIISDAKIKLEDVNYSKLTFNESEPNKPSEIYFKNNNDEWENYFQLQNFKLDIKKLNDLNKGILEKVNEEYLDYSSKTKLEDQISIFDIRKYDNGIPQDIGEEMLLDGTNSWWNIALQNRLFDTIYNYDEENDYTFKVIGVEDIYDSNQIYLDQEIVNELLGVSSNNRIYFSNGVSINKFSNAKFSTNPNIKDQMETYIMKLAYANNALVNVKDYVKSGLGPVDYVSHKKEAMNTLIMSVISLAIVFIVLSIIIGIVIIYLITDMFVGKYKNFMNQMRVFGWSLKEVNSIIMWVFLPFSIVFSILAIALVAIAAYFMVPGLLLSLKVAAPVMIHAWVYIVVFFASMLIFALAYSVILRNLFKTKLSTVTG